MMTETEPDEAHLAPPPGVGPHEGRELDLMLSGGKPLAYFLGPIRSDRVAHYVAQVDDLRRTT